MSLLVATQNYNATAETYVRRHMRGIAPDRTVGLSLALKGEPPSDLPFLSVQLPSSLLERKVYLMRGRMSDGFAGSPVGRNRAEIVRFIRTHDVRLIFAEFGPTGAALRAIAKAENLPLVVNFHGYDATVMPERADIRRAYALLARDAAGFVCGSHHFKGVVAQAGIPSEKIEVIPCGIQSENFTQIEHWTGKRLVAIGRLTPKKAPLRTLEAFAKARAQVGGLSLDMLGDGPLLDDCQRFVRDHDLGTCVKLHGSVPHHMVIETLSQTDVFLQHSVTAPNGDTESQGISLIEAMASGLPVITTDHNGFSETVKEGVTGYLVAEHDTDAMAARIVELAQNPERCRDMGLAGRKRAVARFDDGVTSNDLRRNLNQFAQI